MKKYLWVILFFVLATAPRAYAAHAPLLFLSVTSLKSVQVSIMDADPNAQVALYYKVSGSTRSSTIGTTNAGGNLNAIVDPKQYPIAVGTQVYVVVNAASSPLTAWPDYTLDGSTGVSAPVTTGPSTTIAGLSISTSQGNGGQVNLTLGQNVSVPLLGVASKMFSISSNSSPSTIGAGVNGAKLLLTGLAYGGSNIQVCEFEGDCAYVYVFVASPNTSNTPTPAPVPAPTPKPAPVPTPTPASVAFTTYLKPGSTGTEVRALQTILAKLGFLKHVVTGYYGSATTDAVAALQKKHNLAALGVVGPATRKLLNSLSK